LVGHGSRRQCTDGGDCKWGAMEESLKESADLCHLLGGSVHNCSHLAVQRLSVALFAFANIIFLEGGGRLFQVQM